MKKNKNVIEAHKLEKAVNVLMVLFGLCAIGIFAFGLFNPRFGYEAMIMEMFIIIIIALLAQTTILAKMLERLY
jgi:uncharacterized membrane protein YqjE